MAENDSANMPEPAEEPDPFFTLPENSEWNACIGIQGEEENYLTGYMEAAMELANSLIDKKMYGKRDTLVLPILYNARHAVELALKFCVHRLSQDGSLRLARKPNHEIRAYWKGLDSADLGDASLNRTIRALKPFVESLARIDEDGQELRYHVSRANKTSLATYSLANVKVIQESLRKLSDIVTELQYRTVDFIRERAAGTWTNRCSRSDLMDIAQILPPRSLWHSTDFDNAKALIRTEFDLSNRQFSKALDAIQRNRHMKAILGVESALLSISDNEIVWAIEQWSRLHPPRDANDETLGISYFDLARLKAYKEQNRIKVDIIAKIGDAFSIDKLAELEAMYYLARDRHYVEYYERMFEHAKSQYAHTKEPQRKIAHLIGKTNLLGCLQMAAGMLGRLSLASRLITM